jgi:drug/metabolite transporter (DMT)-like permease/GNAT superfamily N-acetyltransferase
MKQRYDMKAVIAAVASLVVWSSAFAGVSQVVTKGGYGAGQAALLRFLVASATMAIVAVFTGMRLPKREDIGSIAIAALFGITIYHLAFTFGETQVSAGAAALIIASGPIWTALLAVAFLGERLNGWGWAGVALAFSGVAAISFSAGGGFRFEPMVLIVLLASMSTAMYFVLGKKPLRTYSSLAFTSYVIWFGTLPMLVFLPGLIHQAPLAPAWSTWTVVFLGVFPGALAYWLWSYALARMPASTTASFLYAQPVLATFVAWLWQGVVPGVVTLAGGALALAGVVIVQTKGRPTSVVEVAVATDPQQRAVVRALAEETMANMAEHLGLPASHFDDERAHFDEWYGGESGRALLATVDGAPAGVVVLRAFGDDGSAEIRRMYVRPAFRRRGLARMLLRAVTEEARTSGYRRLLLMTSEEFEGAAPLYSAEGFAAIEPYRAASSGVSLALALDL